MARGALVLQRWICVCVCVCVCFLLFVHVAHCFYDPDVAPQDFQMGDELNVKVNKLTSTETLLPYSYYSLHYCYPMKMVHSPVNLWEFLRGDSIENTPYVFKMREPQMCNVVCSRRLDAQAAKEFKEKIANEYRVNMILDDLPLVVPIKMPDQENSIVYLHGFYVGFKGQYAGSKEEKYFINNHLSFTVKFHKDPVTELARIVGFEVKPFSIKHEFDGEWNEKMHLTTCDPYSKAPQEVEDKEEIIYTYDVEFQESDVKWASRWDTYLLMADDQMHWFSIVNSLMIVLFLLGIVAMIMLWTLCRSKYNRLETQEEA